jgi:hypothetical protein
MLNRQGQLSNFTFRNRQFGAGNLGCPEQFDYRAGFNNPAKSPTFPCVTRNSAAISPLFSPDICHIPRNPPA